MHQPLVQLNGESPDHASALDRLLVASATFRDHDTHRREELAARLQELSRHVADGVLLHTCHRVELICLTPEGEPPAGLPAALECTWGLAAVERVFLVASGLDSAVLAEEQVLGQVREAYRSALAHGTTGAVSNELLRRAIRFGKRVQSFAQLIGERSLADRAVQWVDSQLDPGRARTAVVIGTGQMGRSMAVALAAREMRVIIASRRPERAAALARELSNPGIHASSTVAEVLDGPIDADVVAVAQRSGAALIDGRHLGSGRTLVVDLSSPGAVTSEAAALLGARLLDLDRLGAGGSSRRLTPVAERRLRREAQEEAGAFGDWLASRARTDAIAQLRARADEVRRRHVGRLRRRHSLDDVQAAEVEAMTVAMLGELLHEPILRLRQDPDAASGVREAFGLE